MTRQRFDLEVSGPDRESVEKANLHYEWLTGNKGKLLGGKAPFHELTWDTAIGACGLHRVTVRLVDERGTVLQSKNGPMIATNVARITPAPLAKGDTLRVALQRPAAVGPAIRHYGR